jgi:hypothetical protein
MKVYLLYQNRDFDYGADLPPGHQDLIQDLELTTLLRAMAAGDKFLAEVSKQSARQGRLWWLPAGGYGNGLEDAAWAPVLGIGEGPLTEAGDLLAVGRRQRPRPGGRGANGLSGCVRRQRWQVRWFEGMTASGLTLHRSRRRAALSWLLRNSAGQDR